MKLFLNKIAKMIILITLVSENKAFFFFFVFFFLFQTRTSCDNGYLWPRIIHLKNHFFADHLSKWGHAERNDMFLLYVFSLVCLCCFSYFEDNCKKKSPSFKMVKWSPFV